MKIIFVIAVLLAGCSVLPVKTTGAPHGPSIRTRHYVVTLMRKQEPYVPSLHNDHKNDRYGYSLLLTPLDGSGRTRQVPLRRNRGSSDFAPSLVGDDGRRLWFLTDEIGFYDLQSHRLQGAEALREANPDLEDLWNQARYDVSGGRLRVASYDYRRGYEIDPATLKATPLANPRTPGRLPEGPSSYLTGSGETGPGAWLGVVTSDAGPGSRRRYRLHRGANSRQAVPVSAEEYLEAAFLRASRDLGPLRLAAPDSLVLTYKSGPWPKGTLVVARADAAGKLLWRADTGIGTVEQFLPGEPSIAILGRGPKTPNKVEDPVLAIVNTATGAVSTSVLWQRD